MRYARAVRVSARGASLAGLAAGALVVAIAAAQDDARRPIRARFEHGVAVVSAHTADLADEALRARLESGLPQTLVTRVTAHRRESGAEVAATERSCRVTHDLWTRVYAVRVQSAGVDRSRSVSDQDDVVAACVEIDDLAVGRPDDWRAVRGSRVFFAVAMQLNPISSDHVHFIRRRLSGGTGGEDDAFFGFFVSLFVNKLIGEPERSFGFRSDDELEIPEP
jgi:hypothetical protein